MTLVENVNNGVKINKIFAQYLKIKTEKQHLSFITKLQKVRFGTYGQIGLAETIEKFGQGSCNEIIKNDFMRLVAKYN